MFKRLTTRLVLSQLLVIGVATAMLAFVLLSLVQSYFVQAAMDGLLIQARLAAQALAAPNSGPNPNPNLGQANVSQAQLPSAANSVQSSQLPSQAATQNLAANKTANIRLSLDLETRVRVLDAHGVVRSDSAGADVGQDLGQSGPVAAALAGSESSWTDASADGSATGGGAVLTAVPLSTGGAVLLSQPLRDVSNVMADLRARLLVASGVGLLFAGLVGVVLARGIARPVHQLTMAANRLARGDFDSPLEVTSQDELGDLARAFRSMSSDLRRMLQARTDLVANVSHELRTPLTAVKGLVETLRDGAVEDPAVRDNFLASIDQQTDRLIRLVNDLLILSRADSQALALQCRPVDLVALARTCVQQLVPRAAERQITLGVDSPGSTDGAVPELPADPDRIQQVLTNLLDNAIRYSPVGARVRVCVEPAAEGAKVSVSDEGPGISPEEQARVFERFYRGDRSRAHVGDGGAGLGLSIAEALVRAHGGDIGIDSRPGRGTVVWFTLPGN